MEFAIKGKSFCIWSKKRILYTICFFLFCLIDQRTKTGSGLDGAIETFRNMVGSQDSVCDLDGDRSYSGNSLYCFRAALSILC